MFGRRRSIGLSGLPCWLWGEIFWSEEDDNFDLDLDCGSYGAGLYVTDPRTGRTRNVRYNIAYDHAIESAGPWEAVFGSPDGAWGQTRYYDLLTHGLFEGATILVRVEAGWHRSSYEYEEYDLDWYPEIVYIEGEPAPPFWDHLQHCAIQHTFREEQRETYAFGEAILSARSKTMRLPVASTVKTKTKAK